MRPTSARHTWARTGSPARSTVTSTPVSVRPSDWGVELGDALLLPAVGVEALAEVALGVEQPDADERHAEVGRRLEVVAGQHAEAAGVLRQGLGDAELGGEVGDRAQRRAGAEPNHAGALERRLEAAVHGADVVDDAGVGGQLGEALGRRRARASRPGGPMPGRQPGQSRAKRRVASAIPAPVEVAWRARGAWPAPRRDGGEHLEAANRSHRRLIVSSPAPPQRPPVASSFERSRPRVLPAAGRTTESRSEPRRVAARRRSPWPRRWRPTSSGRPAGRRRCDACPRRARRR